MYIMNNPNDQDLRNHLKEDITKTDMFEIFQGQGSVFHENKDNKSIS